jgi:hypothetical protein
MQNILQRLDIDIFWSAKKVIGVRQIGRQIAGLWPILELAKCHHVL